MRIYPCGTAVSGWCGSCYTNIKGRTNIRGHAKYRRPSGIPRLAFWEVEAMQRPKGIGPNGETVGCPAKGDAMANRPFLWAMLTDDKWEDGSRRERASILLLCDGGVAKVWLNDRATSRTAWATGETLDGALDQMEEQLATDSVSWRAVDGKRPPRR